MFDKYRNRVGMRGQNTSEMLRKQSNLVIEHTWDRDPNYRKVYVVKVDRGLPKVTSSHELIDVKFNIKTYQAITADEVAYMLQFRHGEEKRHPEIAIGSYVYMEDEDGNWKWWLLVHEDERPQFKQWQCLECNWVFKWITDGVIYRTLGVQRVQQSYNSGLWDGDRVTFVDNVTSAWLPTNSDTLTIGYNKRFIISDERRYPPIVYQVSKIEDTQPEGLTKFKFTQETFNPSTDSAEFMLCDYYKSALQPEIINYQIKVQAPAVITYSGHTPTIRVGGSAKMFTADFESPETAVRQWLVSDESGDITDDTENYTIEFIDDKLQLSVAEHYNLIGTRLIIQVIGTDDSVAEQRIEVIG